LGELTPKSREHRMRVLENQTRMAAKPTAVSSGGRDLQLRMPLIVEVKADPNAREITKRRRRKSTANQPDLGEL
jgi:hypothetical protein